MVAADGLERISTRPSRARCQRDTAMRHAVARTQAWGAPLRSSCLRWAHARMNASWTASWASAWFPVIA
jgi:hypothetical protein